MAALDDLLGRVTDPALRADLEREIAPLRGDQRLGLVFERHLPEAVRLYDLPVRRGSTVEMRDEAGSPAWTVKKIRDGIADLSRVEGDELATTTAPVDGLVVVREFGDPIYPGLEKVGEVKRGGDKPSHVVINGENYHALEMLLYTCEGQVDAIYIDPPYNTGNDSWKYNDKYVDGNDNYRHSKWLAFMECRLQLAKRLLKPSGVIFISIDDNQQARLKLLCDQVFGESNFVDTIMVEMSLAQGMKVRAAQQGTMVKNGEFVHIYRASSEFDVVPKTPLYDGVDGYDSHYNLWVDPETLEVTGLASHLVEDEAFLSLARPYLGDDARSLTMRQVSHLVQVSPEIRELFYSTYAASIHRQMMATLNVPDGVRETLSASRATKYRTNAREYLLFHRPSGRMTQLHPLAATIRETDDYLPQRTRAVIRGDFWKGFYRDMMNVAKEGGVDFKNGKKPIRLMKQLIKWANNSPDAVILDFFAGSGSTAHAVMSMNAEDGGRRQSISVTNNELSKEDAKRLSKSGFGPGVPEWEAAGVFETSCRPRIVNAAEAHGDENVEFFKLTYEDPDLVELGLAFERIAPLLWLRAGAQGPQIDQIDPQGWSVPDGGRYGVLFDVDRLPEFTDAVKASDTMAHAFIVTDSQSQFQQAVTALPGVEVVRLYESHLESFTINTGNLV